MFIDDEEEEAAAGAPGASTSSAQGGQAGGPAGGNLRRSKRSLVTQAAFTGPATKGGKRGVPMVPFAACKEPDSGKLVGLVFGAWMVPIGRRVVDLMLLPRLGNRHTRADMFTHLELIITPHTWQVPISEVELVLMSYEQLRKDLSDRSSPLLR